jgi:hypothetical protein
MSGSKDVREDFLDEDTEIPGQRFVLLSFISPEKVLERKEFYFLEQFLKNYEINWKTKNLEKFLAKQVMDFNAKIEEEANRLSAAELTEAADICRQARIPIDNALSAYQAYVKENAKDITATTIKNAYDDYMFTNEKKLEDEFFAKNNFQTTIRGMKVRGSYSTQEEATARAKKLQRNDPIHNIFVAEVGKWLAWDPNPSQVANQEYQEEQLNDLMKAYKENEEAREQFYNKNPDARNAARKGGVRGEKEIMSIVGPTEEKSSAAGEHASLFDGPADLALERKLEREKEQKKEEKKE